jgi:hypothetical protein
MGEGKRIRAATVAGYEQPEGDPLMNGVQCMAGADPKYLC